MTKQEYLTWAKDRAYEYLDQEPDSRYAGPAASTSACQQAWLSFMSDLNKHEQLRRHVGIEMGMRLLLSGNLDTVQQMREFIGGFN